MGVQVRWLAALQQGKADIIELIKLRLNHALSSEGLNALLIMANSDRPWCRSFLVCALTQEWEKNLSISTYSWHSEQYKTLMALHSFSRCSLYFCTTSLRGPMKLNREQPRGHFYWTFCWQSDLCSAESLSLCLYSTEHWHVNVIFSSWLRIIREGCLNMCWHVVHIVLGEQPLQAST